MSMSASSILDEPRYRRTAKRLNEGFQTIDRAAAADLLALCRDLADTLKECQVALAMMTEPHAIKNTSVATAFATAVTAETNARKVLQP